jgi:hypothetical protein
VSLHPELLDIMHEVGERESSGHDDYGNKKGLINKSYLLSILQRAYAIGYGRGRDDMQVEMEESRS